MSKYSKEMKELALRMREANYTYDEIRKALKEKFNIDISERALRTLISRYRKQKMYEELYKKKNLADKIEDIIKEEEYNVKKEELKSKARKTQTRADTAVKRVIESEIVEEATDKVADYILLGKELKKKLEDVAKAYGYSNVKDFISFLFGFWDKYKYDVQSIQALKSEIEKLKLENQALRILLSKKAEKMLAKLLEKKYFLEQVQLASIFKMLDEDSDTNVLLEVFTEKIMKKKMKEVISKLIDSLSESKTLDLIKFTS